MQSLEIEFCHPLRTDEVFVLSWNVLEHEAAFFWFTLLCRNLKSDLKYFTRFTGFIGGHKDLTYLLEGLNKCIEIINRDGRYHIKERAISFDQDYSNIIHHHFEVLVASSEYLNNSPRNVLQAVTGLNCFIHDLEAYTRNMEASEEGIDDVSFSGVVIEIKGCERFQIDSSFEKYFTMNIDFGDMVAHYSQVGKTWLEIFYDQDQEIFDEAINPLYAFSGEFDIMFGTLKPSDQFLKDLSIFLKARNKNINDPSLRLGHLPLAKLQLNHGHDKRFYKQQLAYFCDLKKIRVFNDNKLIIERIFADTTSLFS